VSGPPAAEHDRPAWRFLPRIGSGRYHLLLFLVAVCILGPLGGITSAYMVFSLGFAVGGQVLAGILGSTMTYGYGAEGKQAANYMQTAAASVASMSSMAVLVQAMVWLGIPMPATWKLILFFGSAGMFGVGVGMLYTPLLVDRLELEFPSAHAVANILRALSDKRLLRASIAKLGGATLGGGLVAWLVEAVRQLGALRLSPSTIGAGMIVGSRITVPAVLAGVLGELLKPTFRAHGWIGPDAPVRALGFLFGLAMILGAALVDLSLIAVATVGRIRDQAQRAGAHATSAGHNQHPAALGQFSVQRVALWALLAGFGVVVTGHAFFGVGVPWLLLALVLSLVFVCINGISTGITDSNPISSAFVIAVLLMSALGLKEASVAMFAASILLIACVVGVDMQQDRSTGWRLGTNRAIQFRYQVAGIAVGAVLCVLMAKLFMTAYPALQVNIFDQPKLRDPAWQSAMTFKLVGSVRGLGHLPSFKVVAMLLGLTFGLGTEVARKLLHRSPRYRAFVVRGRRGPLVGWVVDAFLLPSPYAWSFGSFVDLTTSLWFCFGGFVKDLSALVRPSPALLAEQALPEDMSATSLVGGGLIAGDSLYALVVGILGLLALAH